MPQNKLPQKLIVTIVRKEKAKKVIQASKQAGAQGGTTLIGRGLGRFEKSRFFGIPIEREREVILTLVSEEIFPAVMNAIIESVRLNEAKQGIGFVINTKKVSGICHLLGLEVNEDSNEKEDVKPNMDDQKMKYDLIVTIVNKGDSDTVVEASKQAGAEGGTILHGRGTGIHEQARLFNILIEPEKEIVLTLIRKELTSAVLHAIEESVELNKPGKGIAFVIDVEQTVGINHLLQQENSEA